MKRLLVCLASLGLVASTGFGLTALAAPPSPDNTAGSSNDILGVVPVHNQARPGGGGSSNLSYHNGPVMHTNTVHLLFWQPSGFSFASGYQALIQRYFSDVAAATTALAKTNVYYAATQYYDTTGAGNIATSYSSASDATSTATPPAGCSYSGASYCVTDAQIQAQVSAAASANHWTLGPNVEVFVFTAKGVGSCAGSSCAFTQYCAYHSWMGSGSNVTLYANMPYADTNPSACDAGQHPNSNEADATINVTSHEHNETITDEQGNAWYDRRGYENGDKCAWNFGTVSGTSPSEYNQTINGNHYFLQQEWSNASTNCVLTGL